MAITFGKNNILLKNRLKWVENNWDKMVYLYNNERIKFKECYLYLSKEPFQLMSSFLALYSFIYGGKKKKLNP